MNRLKRKFGMLTEKEFVIIETLVEEEMGYLKSVDSAEAGIASRYLSTLSAIVEKLRTAVADKPQLLENLPLSVR